MKSKQKQKNNSKKTKRFYFSWINRFNAFFAAAVAYFIIR